MQHLPKQAAFLGRALQASFDCSRQPLPDELNVLLWFLDGAERRQRIQATLSASQRMKLDGRANAWITTEDGNLTIEQIEKLH